MPSAIISIISRSLRRVWMVEILIMSVGLVITLKLITQPAIPAAPVRQNAEWRPIFREFNSVDMVLVPPGCFTLGNTRRLTVRGICFDEPYWIDRYEVTRGQYATCVDMGKCRPADTTAYAPGETQPMSDVTWSEAVAYCRWRDARLPTETEWEYAARGPDGLIYPWGNEFVAENVVYDVNSGSTAAAIGSRLGGMSWVGAYDLSGNVSEWTSAIYQGYPYRSNNSQSNETNSSRVERGGSYLNTQYGLEAMTRVWYSADSRFDFVGFRCARSF